MQKVLILTDQFYEHGGIEKLIALKANYWSKYFNYQVSIICTEHKKNPHIYQLENSVEFHDLEINYKRSISYSSMKNIILLLKNIFKLQAYITRVKPDFIVVASHIPITYLLPFLKLGRTKIIKEFHFTQFYRRDSKSIKKSIFKYIESKYDKLIVLSLEEASFYGSSNVEVIPNPIENRQVLDTKINKLNIASAVIRFSPVKRPELMIASWDVFINNGNKGWKLYIYGDYNNEYGTKMIELVQDLKLSNHIVFKGETNNVLGAIAESKVLLLTSSQECFPMVILEAQSVGVPVISFNCPTGPRNIIHNNENGVLVENSDINMLSEALGDFARNIDLQNKLSENSLINAKKYAIDTIMNIWKEKVFV